MTTLIDPQVRGDREVYDISRSQCMSDPRRYFYGEGSMARVYQFKAAVAIAGGEATMIALGAAFEISEKFAEDRNVDGIFAMAPPAAAETIAAMHEQLAGTSQFLFDGANGQIHFGTFEADVWMDLAASDEWTVPAASTSIGSVYFDTGAELLWLATRNVQQYFRQWPQAYLAGGSTGFVYVDCNADWMTLPDLEIQLAGTMFSIAAHDLRGSYHSTRNGRDWCLSGLQEWRQEMADHGGFENVFGYVQTR